jgi:PII-like signaling protein
MAFTARGAIIRLHGLKEAVMPELAEATLLRIFIAENDRLHGRPLYHVLVEKAREMKMAGATVLPAPAGFGQSRMVRSEINVDAGPHLPIVIEIIDSEEKIAGFLPAIDGMIDSGLVTLEKVRVAFYRKPTQAVAENAARES